MPFLQEYTNLWADRLVRSLRTRSRDTSIKKKNSSTRTPKSLRTEMNRDYLPLICFIYRRIHLSICTYQVRRFGQRLVRERLRDSFIIIRPERSSTCRKRLIPGKSTKLGNFSSVSNPVPVRNSSY